VLIRELDHESSLDDNFFQVVKIIMIENTGEREKKEMKNMKKSSEICESKKKRTSQQKSAGSVHPNIVVVEVP